MKRIFTKFGMIVALLLSFLPSFAYDFEADGICYDISSFTEFTATAVSLSESKKDVIIPSTVVYSGKTLSVTSIAGNFAKDNQDIISLKIGESVLTIGSSAFEGCTGLTSVEIPESTINIGESAFANCVLITEVKALGIETLGINSFSNCVSVEQVSFPKLSDIPSSAFYGCKSLSYADLASAITIGDSSFTGCAFSSFDVPSTVTEIGSNAFADCQNLEIFIIPNNVENIGTGLFSNCSSLKEVRIGSGVNSLPWIFEGCDNLEILRIEDAERSLNFKYCGVRNFTDGTTGQPINSVVRHYTPVSSMFQNSSLKEVYIGRNITTEEFEYRTEYKSGSYQGWHYYYVPNPPFSNSNISKLEVGPLVTDFKMCNSKSSGYLQYVQGSWNGAFQNCSNLTDINIQASATTIADNTFADCRALEEIVIPNTIKTLGKNVFLNCIALKSVDLGCYLSSIDSDTFSGDTSLSSINLRSPNPPSYPTGFSSSVYVNTIVNIPSESIKSYKESEPWMNFWNLNERKDLITLFKVDGLQYIVTANNNVQIIGESLSSPLDLHISSSVKYSDVEFNVTSIADNAFKDCQMIETLEIGEGITYLGTNAFIGCVGLKEVSLPESLNVIGDGVFKQCYDLEILNTAKPIENIPSECFYSCTSLANFSFEGVKSIGESSFYNCKGLSKVVIPPSVEIFGSKAFQSCSNLREFVIEDSNSPIEFPNGVYDGDTSVQTRDVNGKTIKFTIKYYNGYFSNLPIEKLYLGRNLSNKSRYTISGNEGSNYYDVTVYDAPFNYLPQLRDLEIGENVSILGPLEEIIPQVEMYCTPGSFKKCYNIEQVTVKNEEPPTGAEFSSNTYDSAKLVVPDNSVSIYTVADGWKDFMNIIDESTARIYSPEIYSKGIFRIDHNGIVFTGNALSNISIYNIDGRLIKESTVRQGDSISLNSGVYILRINGKSHKVKI